MSKKKKKKKRWVKSLINRKAKKKEELLTVKECKHPMWVKIGKHQVLLCGKNDFNAGYDKYSKALKMLDVFVGLDEYRWEEEQVLAVKYKNSLLQKVWERYKNVEDVPDNIIALHVTDRNISKPVYEVVLWLLEEGYKIGFGCAGGHGRTGWLAAKLIKHFEKCSGDDAVRRIRERFCEECVESEVQIKDLGCESIKGSDRVYCPTTPLFGGTGYYSEPIKPYSPSETYNDWWDKHFGVDDDRSVLLPSYIKETGLDKVDKDKNSPFIVHGD